jgi:uncharacterized membrane protein HdeD (DUF308 family)
MEKWVQILIGIAVLVGGIFIGELLARVTKEELKDGQMWFKLIVIISLIVAVIGLIFGNDALLFSFLFIAIVSSRSIKSKK